MRSCRLARLPVADPAETDGNAVAQTAPAGDTQVGAVPGGGDFSGMTIAELLQLDLVLPEGAIIGEMLEQSAGDETEVVDLTELSLLELMNFRAAPSPQPELPDLVPADIKLKLNDTGLDQGPPSHLSPEGGLTPIGVLPGTSSPPPPPPPPPPPDPGVNFAPDARNDKYTVSEDLVLNVGGKGVLLNDVDANGDALTVSLVTGVTNGILTLNPNGTFSYNPNGQFESLGKGKSATETFTYLASDGEGGTDTATVTITIAGKNDAPVAFDDVNGPDAVVEDSDGKATGNVLTNDTDVDTNDKLAATAASLTGIYGSLSLAADGTWTYTLKDADPDTNKLADGQVVTESFTYTVTDGKGGSDTGNLVITINGSNDAPVANDDANGGDAVVEDSDASATGNLLANDTDVDTGAILSVTTAGPLAGVYGSLALAANGSWTYTLNDADPDTDKLAAGQTVTETFGYTISDGNGGTDTANLVVTITGSNDAPVANADANGGDAVVEDSDGKATGNLLANDIDVDTGDILSVTTAGPLAGVYGSLALAANGTWTYTLNDADPDTDKLSAGQTVTETFGYTISDGNGGTDTANLVITITGSNDAPVAQTATATGDEDAASIAVTLTGADVDGTIASITLTSLPANGTLYSDAALTTLAVTGTPYAGSSVPFYFVPAANYNGNVTFEYTVTDDQGASDASPATVTITVTPVNDAPVANDDTNGGDAVVEDSDATASGNVLTNDVDPDDALTVTTAGTFAGTYGSLTIDAAGNYTYTLNDADPGTNALDDGDTVTETFNYTASDGTASASANLVITISGTNDAPVANADANGVDLVVEDGDAAASGNVLTNDVDPDDALTVTTAGTFAGTYGSLTIDAAGNYTYTLNDADPDTNALDDGDTVTETFNYTASDGTASASANLVITIGGSNDAPVANADANGGDPVVEDSDATASGNVLTNDVDPDDTLTVTTAGTFAGTYGSLTIDAAGNYTYTLNNADPDTNALDDGDTVTETFNYTASDGTASASANLVITIGGSNDAPVANADANGGDAVVEDSDATAAGNVLTNDVDPDDTLTVTTVGTFAGTYGSLTIDAAGNYTYALNGADPDTNALDDGDTVTETFNYTASDGTASASANLVITIGGSNDAPVANADANGGDAVVEDSDATASGNVVTNDVDPDDTLTVTTAGTFAGTYGSLTIDAAGNYTYTLNDADPDTNALDDGDTVTETFNYTASDGTASASANLVITIGGSNDAPVANADANGGDAVVEDSDATAAGNVLTNDVDPDDTLTVTTVGTFAGTYGSLTIDAAGNYTYTLNNADPDTNALNEGATVTETFSYTASDGTASASANLVIAITGSNDAPNAVDDALSTDEDGALTYVAPGVLANDTDVDSGDTRTVTAVNGSAANIGTEIALASGALLTLNANGNVAYDPNDKFKSLAAGQTTTDSFTYTITDSQGATDTATATITITGKNDAPTDITLSDITVPEDKTTIGTLTVIDPDAGDNTHSFIVSDGRFEVVGDQLQLKAGNSLDFETEPSITFDITATDKSGASRAEFFTIMITDVSPETLTGDDGGADLLVSGDGDDVLSGLGGNDTLIGGAGVDALSGCANDDALVWDSDDTTVDGGTGSDTLLLLSGDDLDLGAAGAPSAIERVDLGAANGDNTLTVAAADVISVSDTGTLTVVGGSGDKLEAGTGWTDGGEAGGFHTYTQGGATLVVDISITVNGDILT